MNRSAISVCVLSATVCLAGAAHAQQRPLVTQDPETIGAGRVLVEAGVDGEDGRTYPVSGVKGNLLRLPTFGVVVGVGSIVEFQVIGGLYDRLNITERNAAAPFASPTATGDSAHSASDTIVATKIRVFAESENMPSIGLRFATKLPTASTDSGLGLGTTDFMATVLGGKTIQSVRVVANAGVGILPDPTNGNRQNDVLLYGLSLARALTQEVEAVAELNGRASVRSGDPLPGTESRSFVKIGGRYTHGMVRFDGGIYFGLTSYDPKIGATLGITYVFDAFKVP